PPEQLKDDAALAAKAWRAAGGQEAKRTLRGGPGVVLIDAVFGSGLSRPPDGAEAEAIRALNAARERGALLVAVDVPSGVDSDTVSSSPDPRERAAPRRWSARPRCGQGRGWSRSPRVRRSRRRCMECRKRCSFRCPEAGRSPSRTCRPCARRSKARRHWPWGRESRADQKRVL